MITRLQLQAEVSKRIREAMRKKIYERASQIVEKRGLKKTKSGAYGCYFINYDYSMWVRGGFLEIYKSQGLEDWLLCIDFNRARVFTAGGTERTAKSITCYIPGSWTELLDLKKIEQKIKQSRAEAEKKRIQAAKISQETPLTTNEKMTAKDFGIDTFKS